MKRFLILWACSLLAPSLLAQKAKTSLYFKADDHAKIYSTLKSFHISEKGEYETTSSFQARLEAVHRSGRLNFDRDYVFVITNDSLYGRGKRMFGEESITFDADSRQLSIDLQMGSMGPLGSYGFYSYRLSETSTPLGTYVGSNAFGKRMVVKKEKLYWPCVAFQDSSIESQRLVVAIDNMSLRRKYSIAVAIMGKLVAPYTLDETHLHEPTVESPYDSKFNQACVVLSPSQLWVYDSLKGAILQKFDFEQTIQKR